MAEVTAQLRNLRIAPRKVRLVVDSIRGKSLTAATAQLRFLGKKSAEPLLKLLNSAFANAKTAKDLDISRLYVKNIEVNEGTTLKRFMPRAMGRAFMIKKRTSHIKMVLAERVDNKIEKAGGKKISAQPKKKLENSK